MLSRRAQNNPAQFIRSLAMFIGVAGSVYIVWLALQPGLIFKDTIPTGGDMGAHVWWPAYMRDVLLPSGRIFGWTMDHYAGFPVGQYYFPVPAIFIVIFDLILPYNIAFKLVTVLGSVFIPLSAYILGRSIRAPRPAPVFMAFAAAAFLFFTGDPRGSETGSTIANYKSANFNHHIMGGPLLSNMAGEFSFSIALCFALLFLSAFAVMLRDGKRRWLVALLLALTILSHLVVAIFVFFAAIIFWGAHYLAKGKKYSYIGAALMAWVCIFALSMEAVGKYFFDSKSSKVLLLILIATVGVIGISIYLYRKDRPVILQASKDFLPLITGLLLSSMWLVPLFARFGYTSNMRYEKLVDLPTTSVNEIFELYISPDYFIWPVFIPAMIGFIISASLLRKNIVPILTTAIIMAVVFIKWPEGHAWNLRFLPFWYLFIFFAAAIGYAELFRMPSVVLTKIAQRAEGTKKRSLIKASKIAHTSLIVFLVAIFFALLVGVGSVPKKDDVALKDQRLFKDRRGFAHFWAEYNFEGYEARPAWPEFQNLIKEMNKLEPGRALWETAEGSYGTTLALTLLPYFTDHKISSMEGLYYEAAGSTAYHFLNVAEVSQKPSNPMRWPKCPTNKDGSKIDKQCFDSYYGTINDFSTGVEHMRIMGVKYYLANTPEAKKAAQNNKGLEFIVEVPDEDGATPLGWQVYKVKNSELVEPVNITPTVMIDKKDSADWQQSGNKWLYDWWAKSGEYPLLVDGGPKEWKRQTAKGALKNTIDIEEAKIEAPVDVSNIKLENDSISFNVDKVGTPILVKISYYPTFKVSGAKEIYRASPNFMVVVPTSKDVTISMERDSVEWLSIFLFIGGLLMTFSLTSWGSEKISQKISKLRD